MEEININTISYSIPTNDLAVQTNIEDLTCAICLNICFKPVMISCCERLICYECLKMMIKHSNSMFLKCPLCKEVNIKFEKPFKLINRLFENLKLKCVNKQCDEIIKYYFYFDHIYNECLYNKSNLRYCKTCQCIVVKNSNSHICFEKPNEMSEIEKKLYEMFLPINSNNNNLPTGVINITKLHKHNLEFTNQRLNEDYEQGWLCELCYDDIRNPLTKSYHCERCLFDVCEKCVIYISSRAQNTKSHNHELNLEIRDLEWNCDLCNNLYYKRRSWYCNLCEFDVCIYCYWKK